MSEIRTLKPCICLRQLVLFAFYSHLKQPHLFLKEKPAKSL